MREVAKLFDHIEQEPTADNGALMDAVHAQVEKNLTVLGRLREQLKAL